MSMTCGDTIQPVTLLLLFIIGVQIREMIKNKFKKKKMPVIYVDEPL